jgi:hypothetical protein
MVSPGRRSRLVVVARMTDKPNVIVRADVAEHHGREGIARRVVEVVVGFS